MLVVTQIGDRAAKLALKFGCRAEMMEQVGVGPADLGGDGLQRHGRGPLGQEELPRGFERGGAAFFRAQARPLY